MWRASRFRIALVFPAATQQPWGPARAASRWMNRFQALSAALNFGNGDEPTTTGLDA